MKNVKIWSRLLNDVKTELKMSESSEILLKLLNQFKFAFYNLSITILIDADSIKQF